MGSPFPAALSTWCEIPGRSPFSVRVELGGIEPPSVEQMTLALRPFPMPQRCGYCPDGSGEPKLSVGSFSDVSGLSRRQRSLPAVLQRFCCRAALDRPRVPLPVAMTLYLLTRSGGESDRAVALSLVAPFRESEQLRSHETTSENPTSKPISPWCGDLTVKEHPPQRIFHRSVQAAVATGRRRCTRRLPHAWCNSRPPPRTRTTSPMLNTLLTYGMPAGMA